MPGVLIVELVKQTALTNGLDKATYENKLVFLMTIEKQDLEPVIPDCTLELKIELLDSW